LFAATSTLYRTFTPKYPFEKNPAAVFLLTVSNPTKYDLIVTSAIYDVKNTGQVRGGPAGPIVPLTKYRHEIVHEIGSQRKALVPPFRIPSNSAASFELEIHSASEGVGLGSLLNPGLVSDGGTFYTEQFQLYLPKSDSETLSSPAPVPTIEDNKSDLLSRRRNDMKIPSPQHRDCVFKLANVFGNIERLDALDRDVLFMHAGGDTPDEFRYRKTHTGPPISYGELIPADRIDKLLTLVKSYMSCQS